MRALMLTALRMLVVGGLLIGWTGCKKDDVAPPRPPVPHEERSDNDAPPPPPPPGPVSPDEPLPPGHPPVSGLNANENQSANNASTPATAGDVEKKMVEGELHLEGVQFELPEGWSRMPNPGGAMGMAPVAVLRLPRVEGDSEDGEIRITHFPGMKGLNDQNIQRWKTQVKSDGEENAETTSFEANGVKFTVFDATGAYDPGQAMGSTGAKSGQRFIGVIIDHPKGPHFIKASGPVDTMTHWRESIDTFLKSSKVE